MLFLNGLPVVVIECKSPKVQEPIPGDWEILRESMQHVKESSHIASWMVAVPPLESATLTYRVRVKD